MGDYQFIIGVVAIVLAAYSAYNQRKQTQIMIAQTATAESFAQ